MRLEEEAAAAANMLQYPVPAEPGLVSQGYPNDFGRDPTDNGTQCTLSTAPDAGEEFHGLHGSSPSGHLCGASQHSGRIEPVQLGTATDKPSTNIFLRSAFPTLTRLCPPAWMADVHTTHSHSQRGEARKHLHMLAQMRTLACTHF